ncbi:DUF3224 domain-containing protein [Naasia lichenicola]|uniref:DUF3224 domain-containing protein n=1 Tax=Naasia lichenicola TaxID=2565933 RepID=A0A4S4FQM4_9MICO|nr:DUF3224 domain-containing protein [Naasia lichenicola]THG32869.1 DUF3224 domain-containing protein [Naasia lichenicola]
MIATGNFTTSNFIPAPVEPAAPIETGLPVGVATMIKTFTGEIDGRASTIFVSAFDPSTGVGTYMALESFEGSIGGKTGACNLLHVASTGGDDAYNQLFIIVPASGTGELAGITGTGALSVGEDDAYTVTLDYSIV